MSKKIIGGLIAVLMVVVLGSRVAFAGSHTADVTLTITPITDVQISVNPTSYAFGSVALETSTESATAIVLTNDGNVGVSLQKGVFSEAGGWDVSLSSSVEDGCDVFVATNGSRPTIANFETSDDEITTVAVPGTNLTGVGDSVQTTLGISASVNTWYMIRLPVSSSNDNEKTIVIRFTATAL